MPLILRSLSSLSHTDGCFAAVFDGHGGADVSSYVKNQFFARFLKELPEKRPWRNDEVEQAFGNAIRTVDDEVMR